MCVVGESDESEGHESPGESDAICSGGSGLHERFYRKE